MCGLPLAVGVRNYQSEQSFRCLFGRKRLFFAWRDLMYMYVAVPVHLLKILSMGTFVCRTDNQHNPRLLSLSLSLSLKGGIASAGNRFLSQPVRNNASGEWR